MFSPQFYFNITPAVPTLNVELINPFDMTGSIDMTLMSFLDMAFAMTFFNHSSVTSAGTVGH